RCRKSVAATPRIHANTGESRKARAMTATTEIRAARKATAAIIRTDHRTERVIPVRRQSRLCSSD
ncbi:MAG: hypothetical protein ACXW19_05900, partial [Thermoanaerobaculia bacterium]